MGATRESPSLTDAAELDELRRRAYGPEADIGDDADAIARLAELEVLLGHGAVPVATIAPDSVTTLVPATGFEPIAPHRPHALAAKEPIAAPPRRRRRAAIIAAGVAAMLVLAAVGSTLTAGSSDVTLYRRTEIPGTAAEQLSTLGQLGYLGIDAGDVRLYDDFRGLNVWSALRGSSTTCLFVTSATPPRWRVDCTPRNGEPTIDLVKYREDSRLAGLEAWGDAPVGSLLRLVLRGGAVVVQAVDAPAIASMAR